MAENNSQKLIERFGFGALSYSPYQFALFRIFFALIWLIINFFIFSNGPQTQLAISVAVVTAILSFALLFGFYRKFCGLILFGWIYFFLTGTGAHLASVATLWQFLVHALVPSGEPLARAERKKNWRLPPWIYVFSLFLLGLGYIRLGLVHVQAGLWGRDIWTDVTTVLFSSFLPLFLLPVTRRWVWLVTLICLIGDGFASSLQESVGKELGLAIISLHLFLFDEKWFPGTITIKEPVLFFDGFCGLCNRAVDVVLQIDQHQKFRFSPLQGDYASKVLPEHLTKDLSSLVLFIDDKIFIKSDAVLKISSVLGGIWWPFGIFRLVPQRLRDRVYDFVAQNRYIWFGRRKECRLPSSEERALFL